MKKLLKIFLTIIGIIVALYVSIVIITNIIYSLSEDKYEYRSYACCSTKGSFMGQEIEISPAAPCSCKDKDIKLTMSTKTLLVIRELLN